MSLLVWPIALQDTRRVGESVTARRAGSGRPHKGIDVFADAGTKVLSADYGHVARVVDGRAGDRESLLRAGLFVDVISFYGWVTCTWVLLLCARGTSCGPAIRLAPLAWPGRAEWSTRTRTYTSRSAWPTGIGCGATMVIPSIH